MPDIGGTGPQPIPAGKGRKFLTQVEPFRLVSLDAAAFDWLWRLVETKYQQDKQRAGGGDIYALQAEVSKRAVLAFREAAGTLGAATNTHKKRRLVRNPKT